MQIPLGHLLDKHGPKKIVSSFLLIAIIGTIAFALAQNFAGLLLSRILIGVGVSACLMGPLTAYRIWLADEYQQRANAWMLMVLSMGFVFSTFACSNFITSYWMEMGIWTYCNFNIFSNINDNFFYTKMEK